MQDTAATMCFVFHSDQVPLNEAVANVICKYFGNYV
jgi:hypothetical protein